MNLVGVLDGHELDRPGCIYAKLRRGGLGVGEETFLEGRILPSASDEPRTVLVGAGLHILFLSLHLFPGEDSFLYQQLLDGPDAYCPRAPLVLRLLMWVVVPGLAQDCFSSPHAPIASSQCSYMSTNRMSSGELS